VVSSVGPPGAAAIDRSDDTESRAAEPTIPAVKAQDTAPRSDFSFSTSDIPANARFEAWRDLWMRRIAMEVSADGPCVFDGRLDLWNAGPLAVARIGARHSEKVHYGRSARQARNGDDDFNLTLPAQALLSESWTPGSEEFRVDRRGAILSRNNRCFRTVLPERNAGYLVRIDRRALRELLPRGFEPTTTCFSPGLAMVELLWSYMPLITGENGNGSAQSRDILGRHIVDLVALMLKPSSDAVELIRGRGLKAARTKALLDAIDRHFATNDLTPAMIALQLGISSRQVHRLLEETPKTFEEHVLERRLQHAHKLLTEPGQGPSRIADIALAAGFSGVTQFNRAFRARFGDTPTGVRNTAAREGTLRVLRESVTGPR
jgi:AraC-like DNA-binding protein